MNFKRERKRDEPDINLIPMIDVLLVVLIFLMVSTTFSKISELKINLPETSANVTQNDKKPVLIQVNVDAIGNYTVDAHPVEGGKAVLDNLATALKRAVNNRPEPVIVIYADAKAAHQSVVKVMEAAQQAGYAQISFATANTKATESAQPTQ